MVLRDYIYRLRTIEYGIEGYLALAFLLGYTLLISVNVIMRFLTGSPTPYGLEIVLGMFSWASWLSVSFALRHQSHFRFMLVRERISERMNYALLWVEWVLWIVVMGIILREAIPELLFLQETGATTFAAGIPRWLLFLSLPVGLGLILLRTIQQMVTMTKKYRSGESVIPDSSLGVDH
jgi:TRAP-type C4-dicarboxylate transport system permease small subunit